MSGVSCNITLGPVIGKTTSNSTRVLVEIDQTGPFQCVLTPPSGSVVKPITAVANFTVNRPRAFVFNDLPADTMFDISFPTAQNAALRHGKVRTYKKDADLKQLRCISFSCNNVTCNVNPCVWDDISSKFVDTEHVDLLLMMGDQVYADVAFDQGKHTLEGHAHMWSESVRDQLTENYRRVYRQTWNQPSTQRILSRVPCLSIWDDHDVRNDWGSHLTDRDPSTIVYKIGLAARDAFWEYQRQLWDNVVDDASGLLKANRDQTAKGEFHMHRFGDYGVLVLDNRGSRSFYYDASRPFFSEYQWSAVKGALSPQGLFRDAKVLLIVSSVALCVCGSNSSSIAGNILKDKMGLGLFPKEQLDLIEAIHEWKSALPGRHAAVIGGDLHIGIKSKLKHKDEKLFNQYLTSPIQEEPPGGMMYEAFKQMMTNADTLSHGYKFQHKWLMPARNFGYFELSNEPTPTLRVNLLYHLKDHPMLDAFRGKLLITDIKIRGLKAMDSNGKSDPYVAITLGGQTHKTKVIKKALDPDFPDEIKFKMQKMESHLKVVEQLALKLEVFDQDSLSDDLIGGALVSIQDLCRINNSKPLLLAPRDQTFSVPLQPKDPKKKEGLGQITFRVTLNPDL